MSLDFHETLLRGGSLNKTVLRRFDDGSAVVRKAIARTTHREYGLVRWHSQFKRLQRYEQMFPDLFPRLLDAGEEGDTAWFDLAFVEGSVDLKTYLTTEPFQGDVDALHAALWSALDRMHDHAVLPAFTHSLSLYFEEEVRQRLNDARQDADFAAFCAQPTLVVNGVSCRSLLDNLEWYGDAFSAHQPAAECYTHGNVTLENVLVVPATGRLVFVDPYDENVIDCREAEYSQVLQCCNQHYGYINDRQVDVRSAEVAFPGVVPEALCAFNMRFQAELHHRLDPQRLRLVRLLEASQFTRMLPFKVAAGDLAKAKYFYGVASVLVDRMRMTPTFYS